MLEQYDECSYRRRDLFIFCEKGCKYDMFGELDDKPDTDVLGDPEFREQGRS